MQRLTTPWRQLASCGTSLDSIISLNFDCHTSFNVLLPMFVSKRNEVNFGSPYRVGPKLRGRRLFLNSADTAALVLWRPKSTDRQFSLCPTSGLVPKSVNVWSDYGLQVIDKACTDNCLEVLSVKWRSIEEMEPSVALLRDNRPNGNLFRTFFSSGGQWQVTLCGMRRCWMHKKLSMRET